jgi:protein involved in polysaccharide export with SLBB domain
MLPIVGDIKAAGRTLSQIESSVIDAYYPEYTVTRPSVFARILEHKAENVSITGAVQKPGIYSLRRDQMSLVALIMEAGGIIDEGAALIRIVHHNETLTGEEETVEEIAGEVSEQLAGLNRTRRDISKINMIEAQLAFKQPTTSSTTGRLVVAGQDETILFSEYLDITSEIDRQALLEKLAEKEPRVSTVEVRQKLCALAELLRPGSGKYNRESETESEKIRSNTRTFTAPILPANTAEETAGSDSKQHSAAVDPLYEQMVETGKELFKILGLEESPETGEKAESGGAPERESLVLPVKGFNIPFADVVLRDGDSVIVERLQQPLFTVMGLVNRPGNFPYPPNVRYNLMQALAFAGGLDQGAEPRYATVYRLNPDGAIVSAIFEIVNVKNGSRLTEALDIPIKPGDIVAIEHTPRTRTKLFLDRIFRINIGTYFRLNDAWDD